MSAKTPGRKRLETIGLAGAASVRTDNLSGWRSHCVDPAYMRNCASMAGHLPVDLVESMNAHRAETDGGDAA